MKRKSTRSSGKTLSGTTRRWTVEIALAANGPDFGRTALNERAAKDIFRGWISPSRYEQGCQTSPEKKSRTMSKKSQTRQKKPNC